MNKKMEVVFWIWSAVTLIAYICGMVMSLPTAWYIGSVSTFVGVLVMFIASLVI